MRASSFSTARKHELPMLARTAVHYVLSQSIPEQTGFALPVMEIAREDPEAVPSQLLSLPCSFNEHRQHPQNSIQRKRFPPSSTYARAGKEDANQSLLKCSGTSGTNGTTNQNPCWAGIRTIHFGYFKRDTIGTAGTNHCQDVAWQSIQNPEEHDIYNAVTVQYPVSMQGYNPGHLTRPTL